jgi:hypothetical protein
MPLVTDQIASAGAFVSLETNVHPAKLLPSNNSIFPDGVIGGSICAASGMGTAANKSATTGKKSNFIGIFYVVAICCDASRQTGGRGGIRPQNHRFLRAYYSKKPSIQAESLTIRENPPPFLLTVRHFEESVRTCHPVRFRGQTSHFFARRRKAGKEALVSQKNRFELSGGGEIVSGSV